MHHWSGTPVGETDGIIGKLTWKCDGWNWRADGTERPFSGLDVMFFGDFSQLKPVSGTALTSNSELDVGSNAAHGNNGVWDPSGRRWRNKNLACRLPAMFQLTKPVFRRPPVCVGSTNLMVSRPPGGFGSTNIVVCRSPGVAGLGEDSGMEASRKRWTEKTRSLESSRMLRDDLEGLKHYDCSGFKASRRPDEAERGAQRAPELDP